MNLMLQPLRKYAEFRGRARRSEYWLFILFAAVVFFIAALIDVLVFGRPSVIYGLSVLALLIPHLAVGFRRLHDTDRSAWWLLLGVIPLVNLVLLVFFLLPGTVGDNRYGPDPKASGPVEPAPLVA